MSTGLAKPLIGLWLRRFALGLPIIGVVLLAVQVQRHGFTDADYGEALLWSAIAASVSASMNTWQAYRHGCGLRR